MFRDKVPELQTREESKKLEVLETFGKIRRKAGIEICLWRKAIRKFSGGWSKTSSCLLELFTCRTRWQDPSLCVSSWFAATAARWSQESQLFVPCRRPLTAGGAAVGPQAIPGKSLPCLSPPANRGMCLGQGFVQGRAAFLTFPTKAMRPQSTAWAITDGELLDFLWDKFPAALQCTGRGATPKILRNTELPLEQTRGRPGRWSDYVCSASSTVFARQKKASGGTESPKQSSRWTQTWPDFLICCRSGKVEGKEKAQGAGDASFLLVLVWQATKHCTGDNSDFSVSFVVLQLFSIGDKRVTTVWVNSCSCSSCPVVLASPFLAAIPACSAGYQENAILAQHWKQSQFAVGGGWLLDWDFFKFRPPNVWL